MARRRYSIPYTHINKGIEFKAIKKIEMGTYLEEGNIAETKEGAAKSFKMLAHKIKTTLRVTGAVFGDGSNHQFTR